MAMTMTVENAARIIEIRARWAAAADGPWRWEVYGDRTYLLETVEEERRVLEAMTDCGDSPEIDVCPTDSAAIAASPTDVAFLLEMVDAAVAGKEGSDE